MYSGASVSSQGVCIVVSHLPQLGKLSASHGPRAYAACSWPAARCPPVKAVGEWERSFLPQMPSACPCQAQGL